MCGKETATILYEIRMSAYEESHRTTTNEWMQAAGVHWDCSERNNFYGWEFEKVIVVTGGIHVSELITRAKTMLYILLVADDYVDVDVVNDGDYFKCKRYFQQAAEQGLVEMK